ncbi:amino acid adenylation domain-containing protein [Pseudomonas sp. SWRI153]|uniref:Amino acid adenylation domain-containing protein n=1 Tax=Pseudomonas khorasanensis TaxID=2745508 RepID=A0A923JH93_9PSED|nr:non-ribosomal peptide synthetase [Pseudomonas khorasanensis]MBV4487253.1 amino acid adenylation domain-containing protein [Pseudomonas khorasanensis]
MSGTMAERIAKRFVGLPLEQRRLFLARLREEGKDFSLLPLPVSRHDCAQIPLSFAQQRLLFLWQLEPHSAAYNMAAGLRLKGRLDESALSRSFDHLLARHEVLRTVFQTDGDQPHQVILDQQSIALERFDLTGIASQEREQALAQRVQAVTAQPFDLRHGPLLRASLFALAGDEFVLVVSMHHIVSDGWSMDVMVKEFVQCYQAFSLEREPQLPALPLQYADYAIWQRRWLEAGEGERQLDYWRQQLGEEHPLLEVAPDFARPLTQSFAGQTLSFDFGADLSRQLNAFARSQGVSLFMLVLAGFSLFLSRLAGERDIRVGVPNANRGRAEVEGLIGFFVNTQVLRCEVDECGSFADLLARVREAAFGAQAHQELPFEQLVDELVAERTLGHNPLFQAKFNQNVGMQKQRSMALPGLTVSEYSLDRDGTHFDLALDITDDGALIHGQMTYASDLYRAETVAGFVSMLLDLFARLLDTPQAPLHMVATQRPDALSTPREPALSVLQHWSREVARQPEALAARDMNQTMTFQALDQAANRLAQHLRAQGVGTGEPVAVLMERSLDWLTCVLAILKAGAVYMPLDVKAPIARLRQMLGAAQARVLVGGEGDARVGELAVGRCQGLVFAPGQWQSLPASAPELTLYAQSPAYVIHTSGSTGQPKGVLVSHGALGSYVRGVLERLAPAPEASMALVSTIAADLGFTVLFGALCSGRLLHVLPEDLGFDPDRFAGYMARHRVGLLKIVPGHLAALLQASTPADVLPEHALIVGGEACSPALVERVRRLKPGCRLINHYGPSETTVGVLAHEVGELVAQARSVPVGTALTGAHVYVLDDVLNPVPDQVAGELYIGGDSVALGYLNQPGLTAERFLPDPFGAPGARVYRSGDRVRRNRQQAVEFIGRADDQVKVRGYRVEPAEVARVLLSLDGVSEAAVLALALDDDPARLQLLAWCVPAAGANVQAQELREQLQARLPDYMVPAQLMLLEQLPLTANGKLDKRALPVPGAVTQQFVAPVGEIEQKLAAIWAEVLKLERVGSSDNFFELGGDSILSLQIIARAKRQGIKLSPKQLFEKQTIGQLAVVAKLIETKPVAVAMPATRGPLPLLPIQVRFFETPIAQRQHWNQSVMLQPTTTLDAGHLRTALTALVDEHDALALSFVQSGEGWQALPQTQRDAELLWVRELNSLDALPVLADEAQRSLDLQRGYLLRAVLINLPNAEQCLLLVIHHLVVDGVSWRILLEDLQHAYSALAAGTARVLPGKSSSLHSWAEQLHRYAQSEALAGESAYWRQTLAADDASLPRDFAEDSQTRAQAARASTRLSQALTDKLLKVAPAAYRTQINDLLLTALARVLCDWSEQSSVLVQLEGHGREDLFDDIDLSRTVGWFSSLFPVRLTPQATPAASLCAIKEQLRAVPGKGIGYGVLRYLSRSTELQALAQPRVTFNYLGQFDGAFSAEQGALFVPSGEGTGANQDGQAPLGNWLSVDGQVFAGELELTWTFGTGMYRAETIEALAEAYRRELERLIEHCCERGAGGVTPSDFNLAKLTQAQLSALPIAPRDIVDLYPLSPMQQGILFHSRNEPDSPAYTNQLRVDVQQLDAERFRQAWQQTLDAHDILRTVFVWPQDAAAPVQVVRSRVQMPWQVQDWRGRDGLDTALDQLAAEDLHNGFNLLEAPLLRVTLVRTDETRHHLIYTCHHILMDGWSTSQLFGEVLQRFAGMTPAAGQGRYRDYIEWLGQRDQQTSRQFWTTALADLEEPTRLASAMPVRQDAASGYADHEHVFSEQLTAELNRFAREQKVTLNTLVQAAWLLLLQRYTGQEHVAFGATVAGRPTDLPGVEQQIGLFINTLPVVAAPSAEIGVGRWLQQVQALNLALREHEHTPLYDIQRWAGAGAGALFDSILVFENYPMAEALAQGPETGLKFSAIRRHEQTNYPLTLVAVTGRELSLGVSYDQASFDAPAIRALSAQLQGLLEQFLADVTQPLGALQLLAEPQRQRAIAWGKAPVIAPDRRTVLAHIAAQVQRQPQASAVLFAEQSIDYQNLDTRANRLAHKLQGVGVGPEVRVGVCMRRTPDMLVGLLAILKAGGAYVPLDPDYPQERLLHMLDDSRAAVLLTEPAALAMLPEPLNAQVLLVDEGVASEYPSTAPQVNIEAGNLAYVIYTSGSTGKPKGVAITHGNLSALIQWSAGVYREEQLRGVLASTSICFDLSVWEIFVTLARGGCLVLADSALALADLPARDQVTLINTVPSAIAALQRAGQIPSSVATINLAGEPLKQSLVDSLYASTQVQQVYDLYGPSEDTTYSTFTLRTPQGRANIGRPLDNTVAYLLDSQLQVLPEGVPAELYLGGAGVTRGYLLRAGLTAERFVPNPHAANGERVYRTGDLVRQGDDGNIEYIGRADHQVKIRGFRIELSEIEARLLELDDIGEAVVLAQDGAAGKHLHAYLVAATASDLTTLTERVRSALASRLPAHMVPGHLHLIEAIPLTPNGKLDRKALMTLGESPTQEQYQVPQSDLQWEVATIWQEVLEVERVGLADNFFQLGGHSLLATLVVTRVQERLGDKVPLKALFETDTLKDFCARIEALRVEMSPVQDELAKSLEALKRLSLDDLEKLIS